MRKLERVCGIEGDALRVIQSYLEGRRQRTRMTTGRSQWRPVPCGVPQGSVWGPLLFSLYTADIGRYVTAADIVMYADDVTLVTSHKDPSQARDQMNEALSQLADYARGNRIAPEPTKTQLMVSAGHAKLKGLRDLACEMGAQRIKPRQVIKVLGVLLDEQLTWDDHCAAAARRASNATRQVARAASALKRKDRSALLEALAHPHLDYGQSAMVNPSAHAAGLMSRCYGKTARVAKWGSYALHRWGCQCERCSKEGMPRGTAEALSEEGWRSWEERRAAVRAAFTMKIFETGTPASLRAMLPTVAAALAHDRRLRSRSKGCVPVPSCR
ncbi:MAG: reverse transcriptase domain-containing protein, partial [Gemmatimonadota bacterium]|nr:reverse transcriptase domain-containing protein [Gemmatimonadota bacterium]